MSLRLHAVSPSVNEANESLYLIGGLENELILFVKCVAL